MSMRVWCHRSNVTVSLISLLLGGCAATERTEPPVGTSQMTTAAAKRWNFDADAVGHVPAGWSIRQTNPTESLATWQVVADKTAPSTPNAFALITTGNYDGTFNLAVAEGSSFKDLDLSVKVKPVNGEEDQGGGPIWCCRDENNYYICRLNPLESNFRVYKVVAGRRRQLDSAGVESRAGRWYTIRVVMRGDDIACYLDGKKMLEAKDDTLTEAGMIGLWTKADAVTSFDDLEVRVPERD